MTSLADRFAPDGFRVTVLPRPKGQNLAEAIGFLAGHAAGSAQGRGTRMPPYLWRAGSPEPLPLGARKDIHLRAARGTDAVGYWEVGASGKRGAVAWRMDGDLVDLVELPGDGYTQTHALGCARGVQVGSGQPKVKKGAHAADVGLVWRGGAAPPTAIASGDGEVELWATDGEAHVGTVGSGRAAMWRGSGAVVLLGPADRATSAQGIGDGEQVGEIWVGRGPHAVLWRDTEASMVDLNPAGFETSRAYACAGGFQVGMVKPLEMTRAGFNAPETRAALWAGAGDQFLDLHAAVPAPWNASVARAIEIEGDVVRIAGSVEEFIFHGDAPSIGARLACVWEARRRG